MSNARRNRIIDKYIARFPLHRFLWRSDRESSGDIELDAPILEVFDVPAEQLRAFLAKAADLRDEASTLLGEKIFLITHTPEATRKYYEEILAKAESARHSRTAGLFIRGRRGLPTLTCDGLWSCVPRILGRVTAILPLSGGVR